MTSEIPQTKVSGLTALNVRAIEETISERLVTTTATTATFHCTPEQAVRLVQSTILQLDGRGHPKASLHAVQRKLAKQIVPMSSEEVDRLLHPGGITA